MVLIKTSKNIRWSRVILKCVKCNQDFQVQRYRKDIAKFCSYSCRMKFYTDKIGFQKGHKSFLKSESYEMARERMIGNKYALGNHNKLSENAKEKMSLAKKGKPTWWQIRNLPHPCWIDDRSKLSPDRRNDPRYLKWITDVKKRDGYKCKINNKDCVHYIESHHILNWRDYPEERYNINNGITLCHIHHPRGKKNEQKFALLLKRLI
jgi:hypothetical protein